jgi:hypothetical protein
MGNGAEGYKAAFLVVSVVIAVMFVVGFALKGRAAERATVAARSGRNT